MANYDRLVATLAAIEQHPDHHHQKNWVCGTGMCMAGWGVWLHSDAQLHPFVAIAASDDPQLQAMLVRRGRGVDVQAEAERLFGGGTNSRCSTHHCDWDVCVASPREDCQIILALFHGENSLDDLYAAVAELCDRDVEVVRKEVAAYAADVAAPDPFDTAEFEAVLELLDAARASA